MAGAIRLGLNGMDIFPPVKQRAALLELVRVLGCRDNALRRDECGDWRIEGRAGHIYAAPGSFARPHAPGFQIYVAGSTRWWTNAKSAFRPFTDIVGDGEDEGVHVMFRLPTASEAETLRHYVGLAKKRELSDEERARLASQGHRFEKHADLETTLTGEKLATNA